MTFSEIASVYTTCYKINRECERRRRVRVLARITDIIGASSDPNGCMYARQYMMLALHRPEWQEAEIAEAAALPGNTRENAELACTLPYDLRFEAGVSTGLGVETTVGKEAFAFAWLDSLFPQCRSYFEETWDAIAQEIENSANVRASLRSCKPTPSSLRSRRKERIAAEHTTPPNNNGRSLTTLSVKTESLFTSPATVSPTQFEWHRSSCGPVHSTCVCAMEDEECESRGLHQPARHKKSFSVGG